MIVPSVIESGSRDYVILDCDYDFLQQEKDQLDIKWFFNDNPEPIFQWLPGKLTKKSPKVCSKHTKLFQVEALKPKENFSKIVLIWVTKRPLAAEIANTRSIEPWRYCVPLLNWAELTSAKWDRLWTRTLGTKPWSYTVSTNCLSRIFDRCVFFVIFRGNLW